MIDKFCFHLDAYTEGGGNSEEESEKPPRNYVVVISSEYAQYIVRRIALIRQVRKVDEMVYSMHYAFHDGAWCYDVHFDGGITTPVDNASVTQEYMVVTNQEITFVCYHEASGHCLATERISYTSLRKLAAGKHPFNADEEIDAAEEQAGLNVAVGTWTPPNLGSIPTPANPPLTPMQMLQQATMGIPQQQEAAPDWDMTHVTEMPAPPQWIPPAPEPAPAPEEESDPEVVEDEPDGGDGDSDGDPGESDEA